MWRYPACNDKSRAVSGQGQRVCRPGWRGEMLKAASLPDENGGGLLSPCASSRRKRPGRQSGSVAANIRIRRARLTSSLPIFADRRLNARRSTVIKLRQWRAIFAVSADANVAVRMANALTDGVRRQLLRDDNNASERKQRARGDRIDRCAVAPRAYIFNINAKPIPSRRPSLLPRKTRPAAARGADSPLRAEL